MPVLDLVWPLRTIGCIVVNPSVNWQALATIAAVLLAAACGAIGYLVRGREERRRVLSVSLFHLLEVWSQLRLLSHWKPTNLIEALFAEIKSQKPSLEIPEHEKKSAGIIIDAVWRPFFSDLMGKREQLTEKSFLETIENLSKVGSPDCISPQWQPRIEGNDRSR